MGRARPLVLAAALLATGGRPADALQAVADGSGPRSGPSLAAEPEAADVRATVTLRLRGERTAYFLGETIPLELEFRGRAGEDYYFSTASCERGGGGGYERFAVSPEDGTVDPLAELFSSFGVVGSVLSSWHALDGTPLVLRADLNDWRQPARAGRFRLSVESRRLERYSRGPAPRLRSNEVAFDVVEPPAAWAEAALARAVAGLAGPALDERRRALRELRHLATRDAARALARHYGAGGGALHFDWLATIVASPFRREVVAAMEQRIDSADALAPGFVGDLAKLRSLLDHGSAPDRYAERDAAEHAAACEYARRWLARVAERPNAAALATAMSAYTDRGVACADGIAALLERHAAPARDAFSGLPADEQHRLLQYGWDAIGGEWALPALLDLYRGWKGNPRFPGAGDTALRRIAELDEGRARELAAEEIRTGARRIAADTLLALLPDPLPGLDDALVGRYHAARDEPSRAATIWLVARHGSPALEALVTAGLEQRPSCELEAAALAFQLTHRPAAALARLDPGFDRRSGGCVVAPWESLAPRHWDARVESAAIAHVERGTDAQAAEAARVLQRYGSAAAKDPLLRRLARWHESWRPREAELSAIASGPAPLDSPLIVENSLANALADARSFALLPEETARVRALCLTRACRDNVDALARTRELRAAAPAPR